MAQLPEVTDEQLSEKVVEAALRWYSTISNTHASDHRRISDEYALAKAAENLYLHRS